ncbi:MAG: peptide chain release factor 3 [Bdellovibrio sp.]
MNRIEEIRRRRTFAIISHPDAGKTTLTEKLLYHGGVIHETGEVKGKSGTKAVTSDWMELERQKGISITSSVMTFDFDGKRVNLLDTPGHKDFSEDTYRVLMAVDSACMLMDVAKGVEERTRKLYEVCRLRKIPVFTFINKLDREGKAPLDLLDEVERTLGMQCYPITWPLGIGPRFRGVYNRLTRQALLYDQRREDVDQVQTLEVPELKALQPHLSAELFEQVLEELSLIEGVFPNFDREPFLRGEISPVSFGSAKQNFGVDLFLRFFSENAPEPQPRKTQSGEVVDPIHSGFSAFVFKIQANMDRKHRDRIAFLRICSGEFHRGMKVFHPRLQRELRLNHSNQFVAASRETVDIAFAGDILGVNDSGNFAIGDVITDGKALFFESIPRFAPEIFSRISVADAMKRRKMQEALVHLSQEGAIQIFVDPAVGLQDPILGVVGELQLEVLSHRMHDEYGLEVRLTRLPMSVARWPRNLSGQAVAEVKGASIVYRDLMDAPVLLLNQEWDLNWLRRENPDLEFASART